MYNMHPDMKLNEFSNSFLSSLLDKQIKNKKQFFFEEGAVCQNTRATMYLCNFGIYFPLSNECLPHILRCQGKNPTEKYF